MRIISHSCSNTEIICALGCADYLVGIDDHSDFPANITDSIPKVGPDLAIDPEKVVALKPDLIIASDTVPGHDKLIEKLQATGIPVLVKKPRSLPDIATDIKTIADAIGVPERGTELAHQFSNDLKTHTISDPHITRPKVLIEWWPKPVIAPGQHSWATELIERAGGINPLSKDDCQSRPLATDEVQAINPDIIVMSWCGVAEKNYRPHIVSRRPGWEQIKAVQQQHIVPISEAYLGRPGPRLIDGLKQLANAIKVVDC